MKKRAFLILLVTVSLVTSCASRLHEGRKTPPLKSGYTVAVLPLYNATNDVGGADMVRKIFYGRAEEYFSVKPLNEVDILLKDRMGITLGSQLEMTTPEKLGEVLGVDGLVYGYLINFDDITTGVYNARRVRAGFKLVDAKTGDVVWARGLGVKSVTGIADIPVGGGVTVKGAADIPGINEWQTMAKITLDDFRPQKTEELIAVGAIEAALTVLSLGLHFSGVVFGGHMRTESAVMVGRITETLPAEKGTVADHQGRSLPRLLFPAFTVYGDRDFTSSLAVTTVNRSGGEKKTTKTIKLAKLGNSILSENYLDRVTTIINKDEKKGYILYHASKRYTEVDLNGVNFETGMVKEIAGEQAVDSHPSVKYSVKFAYPDGGEIKGYIWEAKDLDGFIVKAETDDGPAKTLIEVRDVELKGPPSILFNIPEGYVKTGF